MYDIDNKMVKIQMQQFDDKSNKKRMTDFCQMKSKQQAQPNNFNSRLVPTL